MEFSLNTRSLCSSTATHKTKDPATLLCHIHPPKNLLVPSSTSPASSLLPQRVQDHKRSAVVVGCANKGCSTGSASEIVKEFEADMPLEEWMRDKCGEGRGGAVELLECLIREAIMGEDEGKEPNDYNRRAQIFYKSSTVFQALKQSTSTE